MSDWKEYRLGDVTEWFSGGTPSKKNDDFWSGEIPWISASSMSGNRYSDSELRITPEGLKAGSRLAEKNSILLLVRGSILHQKILVGIAERDVAFNQDVKAIKPKEEFLDSWYLLFWFMSIEKQLLNMVENTGIGAGKLETKLLQNLIIRIPPVEQRERIKSFAKVIDDKLILNRQTNQTLEHIAQAIFKSWFVNFDPTRAKIAAKENGQDPERAAMAAISGKSLDELEKLSPEQQEQLKATAALFPDTLVDSELGEIPDGWEVTSVGEHVYVTKGRSYKSAELQESTTALVTLKSFMRGGGYREDGLKEYTGTYKKEQVIEPGELVMSLTDVTQAAEIVGKPAIVTRNDAYEILVASLDVAILRPNDAINKEFFYGLMSTYRFHRYAESFATGTTVLHLNPKGITSFEYAQPADKLCKIYSEIAAPMLSKHEGNIHLSRTLEHLRDALLPRLLAGEMEIACAN